MSKLKPFAIAKEVVWEAYLRVKANKGAAGVDGESIEEFERDLKGNLYKLWNRMSSGSSCATKRRERWGKTPRSSPTGGGFKPPSAALAECQGRERDGKGAVHASGES